MNGVAARARLAHAARLAAASRGGWRAAALARAIEGRRAPTVADLDVMPAWAGWSTGDRLRLARLAALAHWSPRLARTLDGQTLARIAALVGGAALDRAMAAGEGIAFAPPLDRALVDQIDALGAGLLLGALPPALAAELTPLFADVAAVAADAACHAADAAASEWGSVGTAMPPPR